MVLLVRQWQIVGAGPRVEPVAAVLDPFDQPRVGGDHIGGVEGWQAQRHGQAAARGGVGGEGAAHRLGEAAGQRQAEADAGVVVAVAEALERQEDLVPSRFGDAGAVVDDAGLDMAGVVADGDQRRPVGRAVAAARWRAG